MARGRRGMVQAAARTRERTATDRRRLSRQLTVFLLLAYGISWLFWVPLALHEHDRLPLDVPDAAFIAGGFGPILAALALATARNGLGGVRPLLGRLVRWRVDPRWYAVALLVPAAVQYGALGLLYGAVNPSLPPLFEPWPVVVSGFLLRLLVLPVEEVGWRGYALPRLQASHTALSSSLILGLLWAFWHLPIWLLDRMSAAEIALFVVTITFGSIVLTWIYNGTGGSLLLVTLFHAALNTAHNAIVVPSDHRVAFAVYEAGLLGLVALAVLCLTGSTNLARGPRVTIHPLPIRISRPPS